MTHTQFQHHTALLAAIGLAFGIVLVATLTQTTGCLAARDVYAQENYGNQNLQGLVPCGNHIAIVTDDPKEICYVYECTVCDLQNMAMRIMTFFVVFVVAVAALMFANAGVLYTLSPSNPGNIGRAHRIFMNTLIGLILVLAAWLIVNTIMKYAYGDGPQNWGPWNTMLCKNYQGMQCFEKPTALQLQGSAFNQSQSLTPAVYQSLIEQGCKPLGTSTYAGKIITDGLSCPNGSVWVSYQGQELQQVDAQGNTTPLLNDPQLASKLMTMCAAAHPTSVADSCQAITAAGTDAQALWKAGQDLGLVSGSGTSVDASGKLSSVAVKDALSGYGITLNGQASIGDNLPYISGDLVNKIILTNENCVNDCLNNMITSLSGGTEHVTTSCHYQGTCVDLSNSFSPTSNGFSSAGTVNWGSKGTFDSYYNSSSNMTCVHENTAGTWHYHCY